MFYHTKSGGFILGGLAGLGLLSLCGTKYICGKKQMETLRVFFENGVEHVVCF